MGKKYLNTKEGSIEQSVLDVWQEAAEMHAEGMDGRTTEYRSHRGKLESNRVKRENKKNSVKTEQPETQHGSGEHVYEVGTDRYAEYTQLVTPGQIKEFLEEMPDEELDNILEDADEEILEGLVTIMSEENVDEGILGKAAGFLAKKAGKGIAHAAKRYGTTAGRAAGLKKKVAKKAQKVADKASIVKSKAALKKKPVPAAQNAEYDPTMEKENMTENRNLVNTIKNLWIEAASVAVDPKDREELDKEPDGRGGVESAKNMKRAKEPAPNVSEEVELDEASGDKEAYKKFFNAALKKFKVSSPAELKGDDKKKFFDYIDKGWEGDNEKAEGAMAQVREFKIQSMKAALAQVWGMEEGKNPFKTENDKKDDDEKNGNTMTGKKKATVDINPNQSYR